jgi:hypothetical protein
MSLQSTPLQKRSAPFSQHFYNIRIRMRRYLKKIYVPVDPTTQATSSNNSVFLNITIFSLGVFCASEAMRLLSFGMMIALGLLKGGEFINKWFAIKETKPKPALTQNQPQIKLTPTQPALIFSNPTAVPQQPIPPQQSEYKIKQRPISA